MAEHEAERLEGPEKREENPTAMSLALTGASRGEADTFLQHQRRLSDEQNDYLRQTMRPTIWGQWLSVFLRAATSVVGVAFAAGIGWMVWDAAHSEGLLIEPFSVPAELAARGLNGQAFSSMLLDRLTTLQTQTQSNRPAKSYANNWGDDLKVEIPETGVSLGELRRFLRDWLGHETHITGEVWQGARGLTITARASGGTGEPVTGAEADLDALMQKAALNVYRDTQPYRYANYLDRDDYHPGVTDIAAAEAIYRRLVADSNPVERGYAWNGLANLSWTVRHDDETALAYYGRAAAEYSAYAGAYYGTAYLASMHFGRQETALAAGRGFARASAGTAERNGWLDILLGDYAAWLAIQLSPNEQASSRNPGRIVLGYALLHDGAGMRAALRDAPPQVARGNAVPLPWMQFQADVAMQDWPAAIAAEPALEKFLLTNFPGWDHKVIFTSALRPRLALARAMTGDIAGAEALIAPSPADCYDCLRFRGQIASQAKAWGRADWWFARAVAAAPSIPFAHEDWGRSLLARGRADEAIAQFRLSNRKGPRFADAIEGWGEALMAKNRSHLALAKFAESEKYAPNWGRLHLKWGEALTYAGKKDEAQKHFARAAALDLTPSEKAELQKSFPNRT